MSTARSGSPRRPAARLWYATDALGSVRQTLNDSGAVLGNTAYDPWGVPQQGSVPTFGFTGELQQGSNVYLRARWYNSQRGVFTARDPFAGFQTQPYSLHPYQYGYSNPVLNRDPSGRCMPLLALVDGPLPFGDAAALATCLVTLGYLVTQQQVDATNYYASMPYQRGAVPLYPGPPTAAQSTGSVINAPFTTTTPAPAPLPPTTQPQPAPPAVPGTDYVPAPVPAPAPTPTPRVEVPGLPDVGSTACPTPGPTPNPVTPTPPTPLPTPTPRRMSIFMPGNDTPQTTQHITNAIRGGQPSILTYRGPNNAHARGWLGSQAACNGRSRVRWCDEYPFASVNEGGRANNPSLQLVPGAEQRIQAGKISGFYRSCRVQPAEAFLVKVDTTQPTHFICKQ